MSAKRFICNACGAAASKWSGRCTACGAWNEMREETAPPGLRKASIHKTEAVALADMRAWEADPQRLRTGIAEFDRVCGGGLVAGSLLLIAGDPGIGKSTLMLQIAARLTQQKSRCAYISGEESVSQIRLRARRLGVHETDLPLAAATHLEAILATLDSLDADVVILDSIQTLWLHGVDAAAGSLAQMRACVQSLRDFAKRTNAVVLLVGHITKDGQIAGPKSIEHMVDVVMYFEGERGHSFRILRVFKNRHGAIDEIGVFTMQPDGLAEVANPSAFFLGEREEQAHGAAAFAAIEGARPLLTQVQALAARSALATPRRATVGCNAARLAMILAVMDSHCGVSLNAHDIYLNIAGGLQINEPAMDLAMAAALFSSLRQTPLPADWVFFGEISLSGAVRPVPRALARLREAEKLGFANAVLPARTELPERATGLRLHLVAHLRDLPALETSSTPAGRRASAAATHSSPQPARMARA